MDYSNAVFTEGRFSMRAVFSSLAVLAAVLAASPSIAATITPPGSEAQQPGGYRFRVGDAVVTALTDGTVSQDIHGLMRGITPPEIDTLLARQFLSNPIEMSLNAFLIETGDRKVLVDVGSGELFGPGVGGRMGASLAALGIKPDEITDVLITHAHMDHIGGLAAGGKPAFPKATIHLGQHDAAFFGNVAAAKSAGYPEPFLKTYAATVGTYPAAKVRPFSGSTEILPGLTGVEHPGHTPGTAIYTLTSRGQSITFIGDTVHVGPVQFPRPAVTMTYDIDPEQAQAVRKQLFARFAREGALIAGPHIQFPGVGRLRETASGSYEWVPIEYRNRADTHPNH